MRELNQFNQNLHEQAGKLNKKLTTCYGVRRLLKSRGWRSIAQPLLDAMINDVIGWKNKNTYVNGLISKPTDKSLDYYAGYKQALMDFNNRLWNYVESIDLLQEQISNIGKKAQAGAEYVKPMTKGRYAADEGL